MTSAYANAGTFVRPYYMDPNCPDYLKPAQWTQGGCCAPVGSIFNGGYGYAPAPMMGPAPMPIGGHCPECFDDGKISFGQKATSFVKGVFKPITNMFSSPGNFIKGALGIAAGAALIAVTGGAATPFLVAAGCAIGGVKIVNGAANAASAQTDAEAMAAWEDMGEGSGILAASIAGSKLGKGAKTPAPKSPTPTPTTPTSTPALPAGNQPAGLLSAPKASTPTPALPAGNQPAGLLSAPKTPATPAALPAGNQPAGLLSAPKAAPKVNTPAPKVQNLFTDSRTIARASKMKFFSDSKLQNLMKNDTSKFGRAAAEMLLQQRGKI